MSSDRIWKYYEQQWDGYILDWYVGEEAYQIRGVLRLFYPIEKGVLEDSDAFNRVLQHMFQKELQIDSANYPIILCLSPILDEKNIERLLELIFENYSFPSVCLVSPAVAVLRSLERQNGIVVFFNPSFTAVWPVHNQSTIRSACTHAEYGYRDLIELTRRYLRRSGYELRRSRGRMIVRDMCEKFSFVALDPQQTMDPQDVIEYIEPSGDIMNFGTERFLGPEVYFDPMAIGLEDPPLPDLISKSLSSITDSSVLDSISREITLVGHGALLPGMDARLMKELKRMSETYESLDLAKWTVKSHPDPINATWLGAREITQDENIAKHLIKKSDYLEHGPSVGNRFILGL